MFFATVECSGTEKSRRVLLELHGTIVFGAAEEKTLGVLQLTDEDTATLQIGKTMLCGKRVALERPFALLQTKKQSAEFLDVFDEKFVFSDKPSRPEN
ncbi:MAG: uncharacterized protein A8A55_1386 [Amphiamblys sp. WSBS2006]|nr:MAG: uncharacterized protein A8A55_1386 [Amphiamblys sp. WSBS2006]